ncbi:MAG: hypothetical protein EOO44_22115 [Flavobacterium sp.]|nr:MAG: hypothetical protein EOO44_22115 [Flavobacterium sp.]
MKSKLWLILIFGLLFIAPFVQSNLSGDSQPGDLIKMPTIISSIAGMIRWGILLFLSLYAVLYYKFYLTSSKYNVLFALFYAVFLIYAIVSVTDISRYASLVILTLTVPSVMTSAFKVHDLNINIIRKIIYALVILSYGFSFLLILKGARFQGFLDNSNMYGITAVFWLSIFMLEVKRFPFTKIDYFFLLLIIMSIILSGSRGSLVAGIFVLFLGFIKYIKVFIKSFFLLVVAVIAMNKYLKLDFIFSRFENIEKSASDSGRQVVWDKAFVFINQSPWGWGMNAPMELIGTGNMHSVYVRMLLTMGYFFTVLALIPLIVILYKLFLDKNVPKVLLGFFVGLLAASFGEDFIIGLGSSLFIYILFFISLLNYYKLRIIKTNF